MRFVPALLVMLIIFPGRGFLSRAQSQPTAHTDDLNLDASIYIQAGWPRHQGNEPPLDIDDLYQHFDFINQPQHYPEIYLLQEAEMQWQGPPVFKVGGRLMTNRIALLEAGVEMDIGYYQFQGQQQWLSPWEDVQLKFSGSEWRWDVLFNFGLRYRAFALGPQLGFTSGFGKNYRADLYIEQSEHFQVGHSFFRDRDFRLAAGAYFTYHLNPQWLFQLTYRQNYITTYKKPAPGLYPYKLHGLILHSLNIRVGYSWPRKD